MPGSEARAGDASAPERVSATAQAPASRAVQRAGLLARARRRLVDGHAGLLLALAAVHVVVFARSLVRSAAGLYIIPWDFDNAYHRFVVYASDCFRSGALPLWNPFNAGGNPFFINPQAQTWSPLTLLVSALLGYTHSVAQRQVILTVLIGGFGAYALAHALWRSRAAAIITALCFDLTAAVFTNMQHMDIVNAYALLPWLFWAATRAAAGWRFALPVTAFLLYWFVTAGYPAVVAMSLVWLVAYWVYLALTTREGARARLSFLAGGAVAAAAGAGLAAVHWLPILAHAGDVVRGTGLEVTHALDGSLSFTHLWGLLFAPMATTVIEGTHVNLSMGGLYFGVVALPLVAVALLHGPVREVRLLSFAAAGALLLAVGGESFVRVALHWIVPAFNFSRFPAADSRTLMVLSLALLAGGGAALLARGDAEARATAARGFAWLLLVLAAGVVAFRFLGYAELPAREFTRKFLAPVTAQLTFVLGALAVLRRTMTARSRALALGAVLAIDLGTAVTANYFTVGHAASGGDLRWRRSRLQHGFDRVAPERPRIVTGQGREGAQEYLSLQGLTAKEFYLSDYGGFRLKRFDGLLQRGFVGWLESGPRVAALPPTAAPTTFAEFERELRPAAFRIERYGVNSVDYDVTVGEDALLVFNEVFFPGWRATVDGVAAPVDEVAGGLRGVRIGAGRHAIRTEFRPRVFTIGATLSVISGLAVSGWFGWLFWLRRRRGVARPV